MPVSFFDTNVLVYIASGDAAKADRAETIVADGGAVSVQVLNELADGEPADGGVSWAGGVRA